MKIEVIKPSYPIDYKRIQSSSFQVNNLDDSNAIKLALEKTYLENKAKCFVMAEDLLLRGYEIGGLEPMIPRIAAPMEVLVLIIKDDLGLHERIRWNILGIPGFANRFRPSSDFFYHGIVIQNLVFLEPNFNIDYSVEYFKKLGFSVARFVHNESTHLVESCEIAMESEVIHAEKTSLTSKHNKETFEKQLSDMLTFNPFYKWDDLKLHFTELADDFTIHPQSLQKAAKRSGYNYYNRAFIKRKLTLKKAIELIFQYFLKRHTMLDDEGYRLITTHLERGFGICDMTNKQIYNAIISSKNINRIEDGIFAYQENIEIESDLKDEIKQFIQSAINERMAVDASEVYKKFRTQLKPYGIKNPILLNQWIRRWFSDNFVYSKGKSLLIKSPSNSDVTNETLLLNLLKCGRGVLSKARIAKELHWTLNKVSQTVQQSNQLIFTEDGRIGFVSTENIYKKDINRFYSLVIQQMDSNYAFSDGLYFALLNIPEAKGIMKNLKIDSPASMSQILRTTFKGKLKGNANFIYRYSSAIKSVEEAIATKFCGVHRIEAVKGWLLEHGYSDLMTRYTVEKLLERYEYYQVTSHEIAHKSKLPLIHQNRGAIGSMISSKLTKGAYLPPNQIDELIDTLPAIEFPWSNELVGQVAQKLGYGKLVFKGSSGSNAVIAIVPKKSKILDMKDLHVHIYKCEYNGNSHEASFYDYLARLGFYEYQSDIMKKRLRREVYSAGGLMVNDIGQVCLSDGGECG